MAYPIAVIQFEVDYADPNGNRETALALCADAIARGARLVLLPEACISDYYRGAKAWADNIPGALTRAFCAIAGASTIALPLLEKSETGAVFDSCALLNSQGLIGTARKTHLYSDPTGLDLFKDGDVVSAGSELAVFYAGDLRVGIALGFDAEFPEVFRTFAAKGADAVLVALNTVAPDSPFLSAMARRHRVPIAMANRTGFKRIYPAAPEFSAASSSIVQDKRGEFLVRCKGGSAIFGPDGSLQAALTTEPACMPDAAAPERLKIPPGQFQEDAILMASFVISELRVQRLTHPFLTARRTDLYS